MAEVEDLIKEALEAGRAKELLFRREATSLSQAASHLGHTLSSSRTLHVFGEGPLAILARYVAHRFHHAEGTAPLRATTLAAEATTSEAAVREARAFVERGDALLVLALEGGKSTGGALLDVARANGAATVALSGYPGEGLAERADAFVVVPSRRTPAIVEGQLSVCHILERLVGRRLGFEPPAAPRTQGDPFDSQTGSSEDLTGSSGEAVVAELVSPRSKHLSSSVELVPLKVEPSGGPQSPAPPNTVRFRCSACGGSITVEGKYAGRRGQCPECLHEFTIPRSADAPSASGSAPAGNSSSASRPRDPADASAAASASAAARRAGGIPTPPPRPAGSPPASTAADRRRANRVSVVDGRVAYSLNAFPGEEQPPVYNALDDLSLTGLSFTVKLRTTPAPHDVKIGDQLFMHLDFPAYVDKVRVQAEVRRVGLLPDRSALAVGVRFSRFLDDAQAKVRRLVENGNLRGVKRR